MTLPTTGWKRTCPRCKVDRHDRCIGPGECGCDNPAHQPPVEEWDGGAFDAADTEQLGAAQLTDAGPEQLGQVHHIDPDDETVIVEMRTALYAQLREAAVLQDRDPGVVLKRALEHYLSLGCQRGISCRHSYDERPKSPPEPPRAPLAAAAIDQHDEERDRL